MVSILLEYVKEGSFSKHYGPPKNVNEVGSIFDSFVSGGLSFELTHLNLQAIC